MNLPPDIKHAVEAAAEAYATGNHVVSFADTYDEKAFLAGAEWCFDYLSKAAPEFDVCHVERAFHEKSHPYWYSPKDYAAFGAAAQYEQDAARIALAESNDAKTEAARVYVSQLLEESQAKLQVAVETLEKFASYVPRKGADIIEAAVNEAYVKESREALEKIRADGKA